MPNRQDQIENILDHYENPRHPGRLAEADLVAEGQNPGCGDMVRLFIKLDAGGRIGEIAFEGQGCTISQAGASMFTETVRGMRLAEAAALDPQFLATKMGEDVVASRPKCALLALDILKEAYQGRNLAGQNGHAESLAAGADKET